MEGERAASQSPRPVSSPPPGGEATATRAEPPAPLADSARLLLPPSSPELLEFDDDEDLEVFSKVQAHGGSLCRLLPESPAALRFPRGALGVSGQIPFAAFPAFTRTSGASCDLSKVPPRSALYCGAKLSSLVPIALVAATSKAKK